MSVRTHALNAAVGLLFAAPPIATAQQADVRVSQLGLGWARSSVNAVVFRTASLASHGDSQMVLDWRP